eukprot:Skav221861  [mRNA]  locus=scaffold1175:400379:406412:+ [translate_table: standard]
MSYSPATGIEEIAPQMTTEEAPKRPQYASERSISGHLGRTSSGPVSRNASGPVSRSGSMRVGGTPASPPSASLILPAGLDDQP